MDNTIGRMSFTDTAAARTYIKSLGYNLPKEIELHHIVEQNTANLEKFRSEAIHSSENLIPLMNTDHRKVTTFYNSGIEGYSRYRDYVHNFDFETQYKIGLDRLKELVGVDI